jgi:uncharacterized protein YecT (DUF1311 family)
MRIITNVSLALLGAAVLLTTSPLSAASFDCGRATTMAEKEICIEPELNRLDNELGRIYHKAKHLRYVKQEQRDWLRHRDRKCGGNFYCLRDEMEERIHELRRMVRRSKRYNRPAHPESHRGSVYSPDYGVVCDKEAGFCADREGIALGYTKVYLGEANAEKFNRILSTPDFDKTRFTMSNGVYCDGPLRKCFNNKWKEAVDPYWTKRLFP